MNDSNQRKLKPLGGNARNGESVNAIGSTTRIGSDNNAINTSVYIFRPRTLALIGPSAA